MQKKLYYDDFKQLSHRQVQLLLWELLDVLAMEVIEDHLEGTVYISVKKKLDNQK